MRTYYISHALNIEIIGHQHYGYVFIRKNLMLKYSSNLCNMVSFKLIFTIFFNCLISIFLRWTGNGIKISLHWRCVISLLIFHLHLEEIFKQTLENSESWILLDSKCLNNIRYENYLIFANSIKSLQQLIDRVNVLSERYGLDMNIDKIKFTIVSKKVRKTNANYIIKIFQ